MSTTERAEPIASPSLFERLFVEHPREVGESYGHHFLASSRYGLRVLRIAGYCFVHALVPGLFRTAASDNIRCMARELEGRAQTANEERCRKSGSYDPGL